MVAAAIGVLALLGALYLEGTPDVGAGALEELLEQRRAEPAELIARGAGNRRIVVIGDVRGRGEPKRIAAEVLQRLAEGPGVDALVVGLDARHQSALDRYTATTPEDASILTRAPGLIPEAEEGRALLELFRSVYRLNQELGADRSIRLIAAAAGAWPPDEALSPRAAAQRFANRGAAMAERVESEILGSTSGTRIVVLVDALQSLKGGGAELVAGGGEPLQVEWMAAALRQRYPVDVYTALPDGALDVRGYPVVARYTGTSLNARLRRLTGGTYALPVAGPLRDDTAPLQVQTGPGVSLRFTPDQYTLRDVADVYVQLGN